jgi:plasmid stability protein
MATLLIRDLDDRAMARLRKRAAKNGHSKSQEACDALARELDRVELHKGRRVDRIRRLKR